MTDSPVEAVFVMLVFSQKGDAATPRWPGTWVLSLQYWDLIFTFSTLSSHPTPSGSKLCLSSVNSWGDSSWGIMEEQNSGLIAFTTN